ncbi:MAG: nucleotide exchange factor GrpE [Desulfuromonadaceae bacterium]|nr:nucleotide exchange factor GrpE [Desulfuromonadaceae bacterium]
MEEEQVNLNQAKEEETVSAAEAKAVDEATVGEDNKEQEKVPSPEEELSACRAEVEKFRDLHLRACADLDNYRKRARKEKDELLRFGNEGIIRELLPVLDNLERAVEHARQEQSESQGLLQGVEMTVGQFLKALEKFGAVPFNAMGEFFDPARHEAMGQMESADHPPNTVIQVLQKGCLLNDRLLRPALVMVSRAPREKSSPDIENGSADN